MKLPCLPHLITSGLPHFSHFKSVGFSIRLMSVMCSSACFRSRSNFSVKLGHGHAPVEFALLDFVQLLFHPRGVLYFENVVEAFEQKVGHHLAQLGGLEPA